MSGFGAIFCHPISNCKQNTRSIQWVEGATVVHNHASFRVRSPSRYVRSEKKLKIGLVFPLRLHTFVCTYQSYTYIYIYS